MKKNRSKYYYTAILLIHILVYFFKIDKDVFAFQEYVNRPNQTYTEQPLSKIVSYFDHSFSDFFPISKSFNKTNNNQERIAIWNSILLSYNSRVNYLLKLNEFYFAPTIKTITVLYRHNFIDNSSEDEKLEYGYLA
jgi:hypothetical protein